MGAVTVNVPARVSNLEIEQAEKRFEQLTEQVRRPATVVTHTRQRPVRSGARGTSRWRDVRSVRRAFVASLVFAPPKSFEP
jgi:phosphoenolpyruvate carboxylase